tara:strand:- start:557 stop:1135 length:579 start_codon:yes stop_codon:yes gene_type:complete
MGLTLLNKQKNYIIGVWEMTESENDLEKEFSKKTLPKFKSTKRQVEYLCTRLLLKKINPKLNISYNQFGAPTINNNQNISISHSEKYVAIIISKNKVGIDIEKISNKPLKVIQKFISKNDNVKADQKEASLAWCAKETLFKYHMKGEIDFKKNINIKEIDFEQKKIHALFLKSSVILDFQIINDHILVYVCK